MGRPPGASANPQWQQWGSRHSGMRSFAPSTSLEIHAAPVEQPNLYEIPITSRCNPSRKHMPTGGN